MRLKVELGGTHKICRTCRINKPREEFCRKSTSKDGINGRCRICENKAKTARRERLRADKGQWPKLMLPIIKQNAKNRGLAFNLTHEDLIVPDRCPILGCILERGIGAKSAHAASPSVDRIDATKGYVKGNVAVISYRANVIKNDGTASEHRAVADWIDRMVNLQKEQA